MIDILMALKPLKNRMHIYIAIRCVIFCLIVASAVSIAVSCLSIITPITFLSSKIILIYTTSLLIAVILSIFLRPKNIKVIRKADSFDGKERLITAYEMRNITSSIAILQRIDAFNKVKQMNFKKLFPIRVPFEYVLAGVLLAFLLTGTFYIPSVSRQKAADTETFKNELRKQYDNFEAMRLKLNDLSYVDKKELDEINKKLDMLQKELLRSKSEEEAIKALSRAKNELLQLRLENWKNMMADLSKNLKTIQSTKDIADSIEQGNISDIKKKIEEFKNSLNSMNEAQLKQLSEKLIEQGQGNSLLNQSLSTIGKDLALGNNAITGQDISNFEKELSKSSQANKLNDTEVNKLLTSISDAQSRLSDLQYGKASQEQAQKQSENQQQDTTNKESQASMSKNTIFQASSDMGNISTGGGAKVPYKTVLNNYTNGELTSLQGDSIPDGMKDMVTQYFSSLK